MSQQLRIKFAKRDAARYTGHLDLHRAWERILRRAGAPVAYSEGFHPQPKLQFASALPLGYSSECELMDVMLEHSIDIAALEQELARAAPLGLQVQSIENLPLDPTGKKNPSLQSLMRSACYTLTLAEACPDLAERVAAVLAADDLPTEGKRAPFNFRPRLEALSVDPDLPTTVLYTQLAANDQATGRPADLILHLNLDPTSVRVHRTALVLDAG